MTAKQWWRQKIHNILAMKDQTQENCDWSNVDKAESITVVASFRLCKNKIGSSHIVNIIGAD